MLYPEMRTLLSKKCLPEFPSCNDQRLAAARRFHAKTDRYGPEKHGSPQIQCLLESERFRPHRKMAEIGVVSHALRGTLRRPGTTAYKPYHCPKSLSQNLTANLEKPGKQDTGKLGKLVLG